MKNQSARSVEQLQKLADMLRLNVVEMVGAEKVGHFGGSFSLAEITAVLYFHKMRYDPQNPAKKDRDRFLLSKGHSALIQYAALAEAGFFAKDELKTLKQTRSRLQGHPDMTKLPGIEANTGSLGQGLSIAAGMAAAARLDGLGSRVYCMVGDGELAEGQIWEAAMAASAFKLDKLVAVIDNNGLQATGAIKDRFDTGNLCVKWEAFGWQVFTCDGHNVEELLHTFNLTDETNKKPKAVIARTIKGKGLPCAENVVSFHNGAMTREQYGQTIELLSGRVL